MLPLIQTLVTAGKTVDFKTATNQELVSAYSEILPPKAHEIIGFRQKLERIAFAISKTPNMGWAQFGSLLGREFQESLYRSEE